MNINDDSSKETVVVFFHGYKRKDHKEFGAFIEYANNKSKYPLMLEEDYYDNHNLKTFSNSAFEKKQEEILSKYKDKELILIGYSMGGISSLSLSSKYNNVKAVYAMYPAYYINFLGWVRVLLENIKKSRKLKKTLGKERYKRVKQLKNKGASEKYPIRLSWTMNIFRKKQIKYLKEIKNKKIRIVWSKKDEITQERKTLRLLNKKINKKTNQIEIHEVFVSHFSALDRGQTQIFDNILDFINNV